jgi:hypothetical protein
MADSEMNKYAAVTFTESLNFNMIQKKLKSKTIPETGRGGPVWLLDVEAQTFSGPLVYNLR